MTPLEVTAELHDALYSRWRELAGDMSYETFLESLLAQSWYANKKALKILGRRKVTARKLTALRARTFDAVLHLVTAIDAIQGNPDET